MNHPHELIATAPYETVWLDANRYYEQEACYEVHKRVHQEFPQRENCGNTPACPAMQSAGDIGVDSGPNNLLNRLENVERINLELRSEIRKLNDSMNILMRKFQNIELSIAQKNQDSKEIQPVQAAANNQSAVPTKTEKNNSPDEDLDLFASDEEDEDAAKLREERLQAYAAKKAKKPAVIAKSRVVLDVKPWDDETNMSEMEKAVRAVDTEGLVWGASKLVPLAYGINKLQIVAVVEDEKVSIDDLQEKICDIEDLVQSVDIVSFNKL